MKRSDQERIVVISDGTCDTAESYVRAILAQFQKADIEIQRIPRLRHPSEVMAALDQFSPPYLVAYTFATEQLRKLVWTEIRKRGFTGFDILYPAVELFAEFFKAQPTESQAVLHSTLSKNYFERMEAIEFTVKHDDGMRMSDLLDSEIILTGVSRTSKTPTSMYLGHKGYKVANVPLVPGVAAPEPLLQAHEARIPIFMLTIEPRSLEKIRRSRFEKLGSSPTQKDHYINPDRIAEETQAAIALARRYKWPVIDVTSKAIEETASEILLLVSPKVV